MRCAVKTIPVLGAAHIDKSLPVAGKYIFHQCDGQGISGNSCGMDSCKKVCIKGPVSHKSLEVVWKNLTACTNSSLLKLSLTIAEANCLP